LLFVDENANIMDVESEVFGFRVHNRVGGEQNCTKIVRINCGSGWLKIEFTKKVTKLGNINSDMGDAS